MAERKSLKGSLAKKSRKIKSEVQIMAEMNDNSPENLPLAVVPLEGTLQEKIEWTSHTLSLANKFFGEIRGLIESMAKTDEDYRKWLCTTSAKDLTDVYKIPERTLSRYTSDIKKEWKVEQKQEIKALLDAGRPQREVAEKLHIKKGVVEKVAKEIKLAHISPSGEKEANDFVDEIDVQQDSWTYEFSIMSHSRLVEEAVAMRKVNCDLQEKVNDLSLTGPVAESKLVKNMIEEIASLKRENRTLREDLLKEMSKNVGS